MTIESDKSLIVDIETNSIYLYGEITLFDSVVISRNMLYFNKLKPITVYINSTGGDYQAVSSILSDLYHIKNKIITNITGVAFSAASYIALAGDKRLISKFGSIMYHYPIIEINDEIYRTEDYMKYIKENFELMIRTLLKKTKITFISFNKECLNKDWYITPIQALKKKIVHEIY